MLPEKSGKKKNAPDFRSFQVKNPFFRKGIRPFYPFSGPQTGPDLHFSAGEPLIGKVRERRERGRGGCRPIDALACAGTPAEPGQACIRSSVRRKISPVASMRHRTPFPRHAPPRLPRRDFLSPPPKRIRNGKSGM